MSDRERRFDCAACSAVWKKSGTTNCWSGDPATAPPKPGYCPSRGGEEVIRDAFSLYTGEGEDARLARNAARVEGMCYLKEPGSSVVTPRWTRVEDTIALAKLMGWQKIGIATCIGLLSETEQLVEILRAQGFTPLSVCCKAGSIDKMELGLSEDDKVRPHTFEPACNPVAQAEFLNREGSDMNIIVGLCVGHDMLFAKYSAAPVTTLVAKDRVTGHNPVAVLYGQSFYFKRIKTRPIPIGE